MKHRVKQVSLMLTFAAFCWLMLQAVHESGHVVGALITGGSVEKVVLYPTAWSRTDVEPNPHPLAEVWLGPVLGSVLPFTLWLLVNRIRQNASGLLRFFAGTCCVANGTYIAFGPDSAGMDTQVMLSLGCQRWQLVLFGIPVLALGLWLWNGTGKTFGIGQTKGEVSSLDTIVSAVLLAAIVSIELVLGSR